MTHGDLIVIIGNEKKNQTTFSENIVAIEDFYKIS